MTNNEDDTVENFIDKVSATDVPPSGGSRHVLAVAALRAVLSRSELKFGPKHAGIAIVEVLSRTWLTETSGAAQKIWPNATVCILGGTKSSRDADPNELLKLVAKGKGVVIITPSARGHVSGSFLVAARLVVQVMMPDRAALLKVTKSLVSGRVDLAFKNVPIERLDYDTFCACIVAGGTARGSAFLAATALSRLNVSTDYRVVPDLRDAAGYGEALTWATGLVADLELYRQGKIPWSEVDSGAVLWGPPGTGKTLFSRIVAKAAGAPLVITSVAEYFATGSGHLDNVIKQQRYAFERAATTKPSVLFIDELDALPARGAGGINENYWAPVITDLLTLLDSPMFDRSGIVVIGATNRLGSVDSAILRHGRLGTQLHIGPPDAEGLEAILRFHLAGELKDFDLLPMVMHNAGATGADAAGWVQSARRSARLQDRTMILDDLKNVMWRSVDRSAEDEYRIAIHEAGHTIAALAKGLSVSTVTIIAKGNNAGATSFNKQNRPFQTKLEAEDVVLAILAGRAAETVFFGGEPSSSAGGGQDSDLAQATVRVTEWHTALGMGAKLTWNLGGLGALDIATRDAIEADLQRLYRAALELVSDRRNQIDALARHLIERRIMSGDEARAIGAASTS